MSNEKRVPTPNDVEKAIRNAHEWDQFSDEVLAPIMEWQRDQLTQARKWLQGCVDHGLPPNVPVWREIKAWLDANPAPTTEDDQ